MYSSVVLRFRTYSIDLSAPSSAYRNTVLSDPPLLDWLRAAHAETLRVESIDSVG
jgi:hypothetical protein